MRSLAPLLIAACLAAAHASSAQAPQPPDGAPASLAAGEPPGPPDVIVRGRALSDLRLRVRLAEEAVFLRFNEINSSDDFDIHCRMEAAVGSRIQQRVCASNIARELDADYAQATLAQLRGESTVPAEQFAAEQQFAQRRLADEVRRLALEDKAMREAILELGRARLTMAERTGTQGDWTAWQEVRADADGLPFGAERVFAVRVGNQPFDHLLAGRTFTLGDVTGEIRSLALDCAEGDTRLRYEPEVEWTVPANWTSCILRVRAKKETTFALYEF